MKFTIKYNHHEEAIDAATKFRPAIQPFGSVALLESAVEVTFSPAVHQDLQRRAVQQMYEGNAAAAGRILRNEN